jgi:hypothetical protein
MGHLDRLNIKIKIKNRHLVLYVMGHLDRLNIKIKNKNRHLVL